MPQPLAVRRVKISSLAADPLNVRVHSKRNLAAIRASLQEYGQQTPLTVDRRGVVLKGNGTLEAARDLGWTEIDVVVTELEGRQARAYAIADNRTGELADWDHVKLADALRELKGEGANLDATGFDADDVENLLGIDFSAERAGEGFGEMREVVHFGPDEKPTIQEATSAWIAEHGTPTTSRGEALVGICRAWLDASKTSA